MPTYDWGAECTARVSEPNAGQQTEWVSKVTYACGRPAGHEGMHLSMQRMVEWCDTTDPLVRLARPFDYVDDFTHSAVGYVAARDDDSLARPTTTTDTEDRQMRVCTRCGERKAIESFRWQPTRGTHHRWCRDCERAAQAGRRAGARYRQARRAGGQRSTRSTAGRVFGVEMELTGPSRNAIAAALDAAGISYRITGYQATNGTQWELKTDGSVNGHGLELVSPKLRGEAGFAESVVTPRSSDCEPDESTAERVREIARLVKEQRKDDTDTVDTERFSGQRTVNIRHVSDESTWLGTSETDPAYVYERDHEPEPERSRAEVEEVKRILESEITAEMREAYDLIYVRRLTFRQAEEVSGIKRSTLSDRIAALQKIVARALLSDAGT